MDSNNKTKNAVETIQEEWVHYCTISPRWAEIDSKNEGKKISVRWEECISIDVCDVADFIRLFRGGLSSIQSAGGTVTFQTSGDRVTVFGWKVTKEIIESSTKIQELKLLDEGSSKVVNDWKEWVNHVLQDS